MMEILKCESGLRQFSEQGVLTHFNKNFTFDTGIAQINSIHESEAMELGFDINTVEGNLAMAKVILYKYGYDAWVCHRGID